MRAFANVNPRSLEDAVKALDDARRAGRRAVPAGGGSDLLGLIKERLVTPDVVVNLKAIRGLDGITADDAGVRIGALTTLTALVVHPVIRQGYAVLAEAAASVGTPQIRNVGTLGGNICQRPWCWYLRNGFPCYKNGGERCFARTGENQYHAIFNGGPSYIVHPSDTAPALIALGARVGIIGAGGRREVAAGDFFVLPSQDPVRENVLREDEVVAEIVLPPALSTARSTYRKLLDREAWTHAIVSAAVVLDMDGTRCRTARIALGGVAPAPLDRPAAAALLEGQRITSALAARVAGAAVADARPLTKNRYKVQLTRALVRRTVLSLAGVDA